jgi:hypothetical protein
MVDGCPISVQHLSHTTDVPVVWYSMYPYATKPVSYRCSVENPNLRVTHESVMNLTLNGD